MRPVRVYQLARHDWVIHCDLCVRRLGEWGYDIWPDAIQDAHMHAAWHLASA